MPFFHQSEPVPFFHQKQNAPFLRKGKINVNASARRAFILKSHCSHALVKILVFAHGTLWPLMLVHVGTRNEALLPDLNSLTLTLRLSAPLRQEMSIYSSRMHAALLLSLSIALLFSCILHDLPLSPPPHLKAYSVQINYPNVQNRMAWDSHYYMCS